MIALPDLPEVEHFRTLVARRLGLRFEDDKLGFLAEVLRRRAEATALPPKAYLASVEMSPVLGEELRILAQELTVTETYFFRNADQIRAFSEAAIPDRIQVNSARRRLRILSAGCASGEEAYSLAILTRDLPDLAGWEVSFHGIDVNTAMLRKAARARYSAWSLRETPSAIRSRNFSVNGKEFVLDDGIRAMVTFEERNLVEDDATFWKPAAFDIVFCRNVMMYFSPEIARAVVARIARSLTPGGFLFLGHAETLRGISQDFHLLHTHETFYYQRKDASERLHQPQDSEKFGRTPAALDISFAPAIASDESWVDTIRRATERIEFLTAPPAAGQDRAKPARAAYAGLTRPATELALTIELLRHERFSEAQAMLGALPPESARDPEVLLLRAVLLTHGRDLVAAEKECAELLSRDEMSAGAHYVMALCRENAGDRRGAAEHDQVAAYLDPGFAMPRLHLGLLAHRTGDLAGARRELEHALVLLQREDASRLIMFGGGFSREALITLCRAELTSCGGAQ